MAEAGRSGAAWKFTRADVAAAQTRRAHLRTLQHVDPVGKDPAVLERRRRQQHLQGGLPPLRRRGALRRGAHRGEQRARGGLERRAALRLREGVPNDAEKAPQERRRRRRGRCCRGGAAASSCLDQR